MKNKLFILLLSVIILFSGCKKDSMTSNQPDSSVQSIAMVKEYQASLNNDLLLVNYHQHAGLGRHDSCFYYWRQFSQNDSLFSSNFYSYCRTIYANNGGKKYGNSDWNWNYGNYGMMNNGNYGMMSNGNWQCGLDTLQFKNWNGFGDFLKHDSLIFYKMESYGMMGYFSNQSNQCFSNMQLLRNDHYHKHNYHW
jgi:hypothetical protein